MGKYDRKEKLTFGKVTKRVLIAVFSTLLLVLILAWGVLFVLCKGPSEQAKRLFVLSTNETSGVYWMPNLVLSSEEVDSILHPAEENAAPAGDLQPAEEPDSFVELAWESEGHEEEIQPEVTDQLVTVGDFSGATAEELVSIIDIKGPNYVGKMMIILDPSKVVFGTLDYYGYDRSGMFLEEFIDQYHGIAGTNAAGFKDTNGTGNGGVPDGLVIQNGEVMYGSRTFRYFDVIGFTEDHVLVVGDMNAEEALAKGIVNGVSFSMGPVLIQNGVKLTKLGGGLNPRTCIGQREDGAILLAVIEGRQANSLGATFDDLADLMFEYGCVNAGNLDGGSSSQMIYRGEQMVRGSNLVHERRLATAVVVLE